MQEANIEAESPLKFMGEDRKNFQSIAPMLFGKKFTKLANATVDQQKTMRKFNKADDKKRSFSGYHP